MKIAIFLITAAVAVRLSSASTPQQKEDNGGEGRLCRMLGPDASSESAFECSKVTGTAQDLAWSGDKEVTVDNNPQQSRSSEPSVRVSVWDDVIDDSNIKKLGRLLSSNMFMKQRLYAKQSYLFDREMGPQNFVEFLIDGILKEIGDESPFVDYWARNKHSEIKPHQDMDENLWKYNDTVVLPEWGHVLYLSTPEKPVEAPTLLWSPGQPYMLQSYPFKGRLLRFAGNLMHAVPGPVNDDNRGIRSVLLFNTFSHRLFNSTSNGSPKKRWYWWYPSSSPVAAKVNWTELPIVSRAPAEEVTLQDMRNENVLKLPKADVEAGNEVSLMACTVCVD